MFKLIVAGSRDITDYSIVEKRLLKFLEYGEFEIVSGLAKGPDTLGKEFALKHNLPVKEFPANWDKYGKSAGYIRNDEMGKYSDGAFIFWDGVSKGTKHMIDIMKKLNKPCKIIFVK